MRKIIISNFNDMPDAINEIRAMQTSHQQFEMWLLTPDEVEVRKRTPKQNKSLHVYLQDIADQLNEAGYDFKEVVKLPVMFTKENIKEYMFHPVMKKTFPGITSTTQLNTKEITQLHDGFNSAVAERFGVSAPWPCKDQL